VVAQHRLWYAIMQSHSSLYGDAYRNAVGSLAILLQQDNLNPYLGVLYQVHRHLNPRNLLHWGEWGQALSEVEASIALLEKNGDDAYARQMLALKAWVHLYAMDFSCVIAICESIVASVRIPMGVRLLHVLAGSAEVALGNHDRAFEHLMKTKELMDGQPLMNDWENAMPLQAGLTELWLSRGDQSQACREAARFLEVALATSERTYQGLAWEANARVAIVGDDWSRAEECIANALSTIQGYEVPLAAWRVHGTAAELYARAKNHGLAEHHRELSRTTIMKLANSLGADDPLRAIFLSAPPVLRVLNHAEQMGA
jgi:tetratricopeptide (TPR) repeat protein